MMAEDFAVAVCGFGRCGSTMTMSMLVAGGCPPGNAAEPPYEGAPADLFGRDLSGTCVKLLDPEMESTSVITSGPTPAWRFVWLDRDPVEQAKSFAKFVSTMGPVSGLNVGRVDIGRVADSYRRNRPRALGMLRAIGPVLVLDYERVLISPRKAAKLLRRETWPLLDVDAAATAVHERDGRCRPDLAYELGLAGSR
jgi:hypothetical protein